MPSLVRGTGLRKATFIDQKCASRKCYVGQSRKGGWGRHGLSYYDLGPTTFAQLERAY